MLKNFFKKYTKLKKCIRNCFHSEKRNLEELNYIESIVYELESASSIEELANIFDEISENNIFKR